MKENPWFVVAVIEFIILLFVLGPKALALIPKRSKDEQEKTKKRDDGQVGTVKNLERTLKGIMGCGGEVTIFEVHKEDGKVLFAGLDGNEDTIYEGCSIELWPSSESIANEDVTKSKDNGDGTKSTWKEDIKWYRPKKYRVLPEVMPEEPEVLALEDTSAETAH